MSEFWKGIALDWGPTIPTVIEPKDDAAVLRSSVLWIVLTRLGERVMQPEFGSLLPGAVFEPNDVATGDSIKNSVRDAISRWDDRIEFIDFTVESSENHLYCTLEYKQNVDPLHDGYRVVEFDIIPEMFAG